MPEVNVSGKKIYFAHCPKAGGSSVEDYMQQRFGDLSFLDRSWYDTTYRGRGSLFSRMNPSPQHMAWEDFEKYHTNAPDEIFTIVRHPVSRMISEFRFQKRTGLYRGFSKRNFSEWLVKALSCARIYPSIFDNHLRPQVDFIPSRGVRIFKIEEGLDPVVDYLDEISGCRADQREIPRAEVSRGVEDIIANPEETWLIEQFFAEDYERFDYQKSGQSRLEHEGAGRRRLYSLLGDVRTCLRYNRGVL